ncbi:hypothetical protein N7470_003241 [Penicillium chermesinum]|nr:hypothetical protein N7470_003241 [Penicillium chermesinum]
MTLHRAHIHCRYSQGGPSYLPRAFTPSDTSQLLLDCGGGSVLHNLCLQGSPHIDNNPMLRDGITGDWIGTFLGHKGAVWQSRLSADAAIAATAAADFSAKVWDTYTGECLHTLQHAHIVRAIAFPIQANPQVLATGSAEKKLRIFDLTRSGGSNGSSPSSPENADTIASYEIGPGVHGGTIKSIVWNQDPSILTTAAEDRKLRWWDLRSRARSSSARSTGRSGPGKSVYVYDGVVPGRILKKFDFDYDVASAAVNQESGRLVTGSANDTWARVYDLDTQEELEVQKGHHGPIWSVSFSPDGKLYGTGSEDGTIKLWKACREPYGLWR